MKFTYTELKSILELLKKAGYSFTSFDNYDPEGKVFLRHDVDCSLSKALEMAFFESDRGLASTFFIQPDSDFYNPLSGNTVDIIYRIVDLGHKIGLHISPSNCQDPKTLGEYIEASFDYYSRFFPLERIFSFHRPGSFAGWRSLNIIDFINVYSVKYFEEIFYFSDSNRKQFLSPEFYASLSTGKSIQLLTHPIWWSKNGNGKKEVADYLFREKRQQTILALRGNIRLFFDLHDEYLEGR